MIMWIVDQAESLTTLDLSEQHDICGYNDRTEFVA